jgi:hypothetical protein
MEIEFESGDSGDYKQKTNRSAYSALEFSRMISMARRVKYKRPGIF